MQLTPSGYLVYILCNGGSPMSGPTKLLSPSLSRSVGLTTSGNFLRNPFSTLSRVKNRKIPQPLQTVPRLFHKKNVRMKNKVNDGYYPSETPADSSGNSRMQTILDPLQQEVHRKLGQCMIRLQQYERLMKAVVAKMAVEGPPGQLRANHEQQIACVSTKTLGALVGALTGSYLVPAVPEGGDLGDGGTNQGHPVEGWVKIRHQLALPTERYDLVKQGLAELVAMRNAMVHRFLERFDLELEADCRAATAYLDACLQQIDVQNFELENWARGMEWSRALMASFIQTPQFEDALFHGIWPDGSIHWASSTIVTCLRDAECTCAVDGWTLLDSAILFVGSNYPDHVPSRYGCKNWRQVLKKSEQFEIRTDINSFNGRGQTWYRSRMEIAERQGKSV
jgi:hypothetical protein